MKLPLLMTFCALFATTPLLADGDAEASRLDGLVAPRARVIVDNDFGGDPDGLFQLAQHLLSPSVELRGIIGSRNYADGFYGAPGTAAHACEVANALLKSMRLEGCVPVVVGAEEALRDSATPVSSDAARFIVEEAMRDDVQTPLYIACGGGLTNIASAWLIEPRIAGRLTLVWIGGPEYAGLALPPPGAPALEYNLGIDIQAARVIFNESQIQLWQVPRDVYRQALVSQAELRHRLRGGVDAGNFLMDRMDELLGKSGRSLGEAYALGDSPLVLLTALQSSWDPDTSSSSHVTRAAPLIGVAGTYEDNPDGRAIRVYTSIDARLMFEDFFAKMSLDARR